MSLQLRLSLLYGAICVGWVIVSDRVIQQLAGSRLDILNRAQLVEDCLFIGLTTIALFFLLRYEFRRRQAREQRLSASEQQFQELFLRNPAPMYIVDPVTKRFVDVNEAILTDYGYSREEFLSMSTTDIRPPEDVPSLLEGLAQVERSWAMRGMWRHLRKNGELLNVEVTSRKIDFNGREALIQVIRDVTAQTKLQGELENTNSTLHTILDASPVAIYAVDRNFHVTFWSPAAEQLFGWTAAEIVGQELRNIPDEYKAEAAGYRARLLAGEKLPILEIERLRKDGTRLKIRNATAATHDHDGNVNGILGISQDMSAEIDAQLSLRRLAAIVQASDDSTIVLTTEGIIASWNVGAERIFGYQADEIVGKSIEVLTPPDRVEAVQGLVGLIEKGVRIDHMEALGLTKDGRQVELSMSVFLIEDVGAGANIALISRDMTERKRIEMQLVYQANLLQNVSDAIVAVDTEWRVTSWNKAAETLYGWTESEVLGKVPDDFLHTEYLGITPDEGIRSMLEAGYWHGEVIEYHKNGTPLHILNSTSVLKDANGQTIGAVGIERDITWQQALADEKKTRQHLQDELEREVEMNTLRRRFVSMVSHEFRTPLSAIQSSTDLLKHYGQRMSDAQRDVHLGQVQGEVERITELLNDFLTLSRLETVGVQFDPKPIELLSLVRETVDAAHTSWPNRSVELFANSECPPVLVDHKLVRQATMNLLSNAIKYSPQESTVRIKLTFHKDAAEIAVQDEGIGIPEADQAHLFEQFYRASNVGATQGTGLGLAIVRRAVEAHGGTVSVKSAVGSGTTIGFTLPLSSDQSA